MTAPVPVLQADEQLQSILDRLVAMSERDHYDPYTMFDWPDSLPENEYWMTPELLSIHGTKVAESFTEEQKWAISKWESVNFYSLNVDGIRELITEIIARIHTKDFALSSEYFHHMIGEENSHMWFFARFCLLYGGKVYPDKGVQLEMKSEGESAHFLVFARLLLFEEVVDFFNKRMGDDERLHPTIRKINAIHHQDESRHVAFGRQIVSHLHRQLREKLSAQELAELELYLKRYLRKSVDGLVNPAAFKDAGIPNPYRVRNEILADPAFHELERKMLKRSMSFLVNEGIFTDDVLPRS
ncbi:diiron oxygenase [Streptomyces sp. ISL-66]|uniref:diiron oxygenase n=1 Tax=Streptomyces sp. ISL-66 TaxID=2819186 RepID=UPI001BE9744A|nr:diiron oxygenase [Streptomyces sp. ISL-66]MBT2472574.1 diiron oxygenase [Streptomyces sp. ISL-66]